MLTRVSAVLLALLIGNSLLAQDTIRVQTLTFDDIYNRRGVYQFPESGDYEKILMHYTLKCDSRTAQDKYACGEWDYLTYAYVYDHNATYDSTYSTTPNFRINEQAQDSFFLTNSAVSKDIPVYFNRNFVTEVVDSTHYALAKGNETISGAMPLSNLVGRSQFLYKAQELIDAGLVAGDIHGLNFHFLEKTIPTQLKLSVAQLTLDSLLSPLIDETDFTELYNYVQPFDSGLQYVHFTTPLNWDGKSDLLFDMQFDNDRTDNDIDLMGTANGFTNRLSVAANNEYSLQFGTWRDFVNLGANDSINENKPRTIEMWMKTEGFNGGGIFQAGANAHYNKDFSFRTLSKADNYRMQMATTNGDAIFQSQNEWHHIALTYNGTVAKLFVDGKLFRSLNADLSTSTADILLGRWANSFYQGLIDDVRIWKRALPATVLEEWMFRTVDNSHPHYDMLIGNYNCNEGFGDELINANGKNGQMMGSSWWHRNSPADLRTNWVASSVKPNIILVQGNFKTQAQSLTKTVTITVPPVMVYEYANASTNKLIDDNAANHPKLETGRYRAWKGNYDETTFDVTLNDFKTIKIGHETKYVRNDNKWYSPTVQYEIARYITPYGINLTLGPNGRTWTFDVTDYADLLKGEVDLSAGNQQELIDLEFVFIKGTPARKVLKLEHIWSYGSKFYRNLASDSDLAPTTISLLDQAKTYKVKTRLTGHEHASNDGSAPHCCEWRDNTHYMFVNGKQHAEWHIWREDCDRNPLYPQGGTWPGAREGWCPGDLVPDFEFEITNEVGTNKTVELDYRISPVPTDNLGMGNGRYITNMELVQYTDFAFANDAEIYEVHRPTNWEYRSRINPSCEGPIIEIRNRGSQSLTSLEFSYWVDGNTPTTYSWTGNLEPMQKEQVQLPITGSGFWVGNSNKFQVEISKPNGDTDQYAANNAAISYFQLPDIYSEKFVIQLRTNEIPQSNRYEIRDATGKVVFEKSFDEANTTYNDTVDLAKGCYTFHLFDADGAGLSYWAWAAQGNGYLRWRRESNFGLIKDFEPDFGEEI
ncbi:MAG: hypothetical protein KDC92_05890, partial [Bacteroidetes bacterium]|nr:hypothetical protein [Bacteroidota bacterium]